MDEIPVSPRRSHLGGEVGAAAVPQATAGQGQGRVGGRQVARAQGPLRVGQRGHHLVLIALGGHRPLLLALGRLAVHPQHPGPGEGENQHGRRCGRRLPAPPLALLGGLHLGRRPFPLRPPQSLLHRLQVRRHRRGHLAAVARSILALGGQAALRQGDQLLVCPAAVQPGVRVLDLALRGLRVDGLERVTPERRLAGQDSAEHGAQAEHVAACVHPADDAGCLFRRHERRSAQHAARLRERAIRVALAQHRGAAGRRLRLVLRGLASGVAQHLGKSPIHHLHLAEGPHHHVGRLQIAVNDVVRMRVRQRLADLLERQDESAAVRSRIGPRHQHFLERLPLDQLHGQERSAVGQRAQVMHRRDGRVLKVRRDERLVGEAASGAGVGCVPILQHFDRHLAAQGCVGGAVDDTHAAAGDLGMQVVARSCRQGERRCIAGGHNGRVAGCIGVGGCISGAQ
ncbi:MAG: hypothetical protein U0790_13170 [Isosphaeraceae bacterium]